ncbi:mitochondrial ribosomal protein L37-domain-containing protein [Leptodontidium sp. 2 PMI_412]|nr:mitochondrial ribosomal protein L37-domain-containing protein [Leptodontidium sp. MPI-SDFR-AT-0119]KAH9212037.1 mitochondrial ribosomal protein L37-domain-containing protein [Leptodontidium sp. 2 PMI_412]
MICTRCLRLSSSSSIRTQSPSLIRTFSQTTSILTSPTPSASSPATSVTTLPSLAQPFSTPLTSPGKLTPSQSKAKGPAIVSSCPAGTPLKGLNYLKGRDDPVALAEEEYPDWLWTCLDKKKVEGEEGGAEGDEFSKSAKLRRKAAKRARKLEAMRLAAGEAAPEARIPITQQSIDLPFNSEGTTKGALDAEGKREELRGAMRRERRKGIKEANFLRGM